MTLLQRLALPILVLVVDVAYWVLTYEPAGTVLLFLFAIALGVMMAVPDPERRRADGAGRPGLARATGLNLAAHAESRTLRLPWRPSRQRSVRHKGTNGRSAPALVSEGCTGSADRKDGGRRR